jgi:PAS domain S-box-containing protein
MESQRVSILLVDDRPENLISLRAVLDNPEYRLVSASSGNDALRALLNEDFALILMDVQMPGLDGFETAGLIKMRDRSRNIPIIFVTALSKDEPFVYKGYSVGAVDYIFKPFDPKILRSKVSVFADLHRMKLQISRDAELIRKQEGAEREKELAEHELISLRRQQEASLRYRDLVEGFHDGIVWVSNAQFETDKSHFSFVSPQVLRITGFEVSEWMDGESFLKTHTPEEDFKKFHSALGKSIESGIDESVEHRFVCRDGRLVWFKTSFRRANSDGRPEIRGLSVDITKVKFAEETAQAAVKLRDDFLSIASHELKTPLTPLRLQIQLLKRNLERDPALTNIMTRCYKSIESSVKQVDRLAKLVDELLDVSRINAGQMQIEREEFDLRDMVRENLLRFKDEISDAGCALDIHLPYSVRGYWDPLRIEQVFVNVLTNAIKYGRGKPIRVSLEKDCDRVTLKIVDHGIGIGKEDSGRIFNRFERAVSPSEFGGLGLGLFIVTQILEAHDGKISLQSEVGLGSDFSIELPLVQASPGMPVSSESPKSLKSLKSNDKNELAENI